MVGLALEGGGARGAFHMGAVKALLEEGYDFQGVAGTSIGALNGALIAQGDFETGYRLWETLNSSIIFEMDEAKLRDILSRKIDRDTRTFLTAKIKQIIENKGIDTSGIRKLLNDCIDEKKIRESPMDFGIVTVSLSDFKPLELYKEDIPEGRLVDYLMASANYPVFRIEPIDGKFYIDGGFYDNCPANLLIRKGYRKLVIVRTFARGIIRKLEDESVEVIRISPSEDLGSILNFDEKMIQNNLKLGYYDAMRAVRRLKGRKYYIEPVSDDYILESLLSIPDAVIEKLGRIMHISSMNPKRMLFERILPGLSETLRLRSSATYQDIVMGALEYLAEEKGLDKFRIRSFSEFLEDVRSLPAKAEEPSDSLLSIDAIRRKTRAVIFREDTLREAARQFLDVL